LERFFAREEFKFSLRKGGMLFLVILDKFGDPGL
jgi:hypothetical protein